MSSISQFFRLCHINYILAKHGLEEIILATRLFAPIRFIKYFNPWNWFRDKNLSMAKRVRLALEELGPMFVKFGQTLSTRQDLFPDEFIHELEKLQDKVPPFSGEKAIEEIEKAYDKKITDIFEDFVPKAFASASIAQVHSAKLRNGKSVVVKVRRPNVEKLIRRDIALLYTIAQLAERYTIAGRRLHAVEIVREFEKTTLNELNLVQEAANGAQLRRNFQNSKLLYVPEIYWDFTRDNVMVMERIHGIRVSEIETLKERKVDLKLLAERGVEIFFTQVFRDSFFHADMHPGNIFVSYEHPKDPQYIAVDYGIVGTLSKSDQRYLAENMIAFFRRDYRRVAELHLESGWIPPDTRVNDFEVAIRVVCEPIFEKPLKDISFGNLLLRLFQVGKRFHMEVQPQLLLLQKTLLHIEGLGRRLYPELDLWKTAKPYLENWLRQQVGPKALLKNIKQQLPYWVEKLPEIPDLLYRSLQQAQHPQQTTIQQVEVEKKPKRSAMWFGFGIGLLVIGSIAGLVGYHIWEPHISLADGSWIVGGAGVISLLIAAWPRES